MSASLVSRRVPLLRKAATRAFTTSQPRMDFGWNKLVTPLTNPGFISRMKELDTKFSSMKTEMFGVAPKVDEVDWKFWEANISNKALLQSLRKEYESAKFDDVKGEDLSKINADLDFAIEKATGAAAISKEELPKLQAELQRAIAEKKAVHDWTAEDYYAAMPGLEQQMRDEYMRGEFLPSEAEERLEAQDVNEARKQFKAGAEITIPDDFPDRVGDYSIKEEEKKTEAMLERMFAGSKQYEQNKQAEREARAKKAAAHAAAAHH